MFLTATGALAEVHDRQLLLQSVLSFWASLPVWVDTVSQAVPAWPIAVSNRPSKSLLRAWRSARTVPLAPPEVIAASMPCPACSAASDLLYHVDPTNWLYVVIAACPCWQPAGGPLGWARAGAEKEETGEVAGGVLSCTVGGAGSCGDPCEIGEAGLELGCGAGEPDGMAYARKAMTAAATPASALTAAQLVSFLGGAGTDGGPVPPALLSFSTFRGGAGTLGRPLRYVRDVGSGGIMRGLGVSRR